jgi:hypothetical protein
MSLQTAVDNMRMAAEVLGLSDAQLLIRLEDVLAYAKKRKLDIEPIAEFIQLLRSSQSID